MIVLLTGLPGEGKTTVLTRFLEQYTQDCFWIISKELRETPEERIGFEALTSEGERGIFAHKRLIESDQLIGTYRVDLPTIDRLFTDPILRALQHDVRPLVLDEIGRMQILSPAFIRAIDMLFASSHHVLATIRHGDDWAEPYKRHPNAVVFSVSRDNRELLPDILKMLFRHLGELDQLSPVQTVQALSLLRSYAEKQQFLQMQKLFTHALRYVHRHRFVQVTPYDWKVEGDHDQRHVRFDEDAGEFVCDCDLFLGRGRYAQIPGECSHIQTVKIVLSETVSAS